MAVQQKIAVGSKEFTLFSNPSSIDSPAIWRHEDATIAPMFRPTIKHTARPNSLGTNVNSKVVIDVPIVTTVLDRQTSTSKVRGTFDFTSLQNTASDVSLVLAIDASIAALTALKSNLIAGRTI